MTQHVTGGRESGAGDTAHATTAAHARVVARFNMVAAVAFVLGVVALFLGFISATHVAGLVLGIIGLPVALYSQMMSVTTGQRWLNVVGMVGSFVGAGFALRHGGFTM
ncbi:hypothetical protein BTM25_07270 [Actinomadura rubteroloni]|uniref:FUSC family protein n=1 Tax=Actinomadura rubteroloni TaxID=1926885 RepID=A0A2P4UMQ1_9ACTN|nr:hypothetical protein [Actinomadura rubteroloni]POM26330.1 hypothetical protein BTM25_07270 [Actinomadura rubteroloni]